MSGLLDKWIFGTERVFGVRGHVGALELRDMSRRRKRPHVAELQTLRALRCLLSLLLLVGVFSLHAAPPPNQPTLPVRVPGPTNIALPHWTKTPSNAAPIVPAAPRSSLGKPTNAPAMGPRLAGKTNGPAGAKGPNPAPQQPTGFWSNVVDRLREFRGSNKFFPVIIAVFACLGAIALFWSLRPKRPSAPPPVPTAALSIPTASIAAAKKSGRQAPIHACNVLRVTGDARQLWHFDARGGRFHLGRDLTSFTGEALPDRLVAKDWRSLFQRKLNLAWLPSDQVFLRVAQFPASDFKEVLGMAELQLEKLSPMPVGQIAWTIHLLDSCKQSTPVGRDERAPDEAPPTQAKLQTVIVMIAARSAVEEFLGKLEGEGYLADSLELPALDQLRSTAITGDGAWIYPEAGGGKNTALVAWWYGGTLRNLDLVTLPATNQAASIKEQLLQMAWAGEVEGWLTSEPRWHLMADPVAATEWEPALTAGLEQPVQVITPPSPAELAAMTAQRNARAEPGGNLLPPEFSTRYRQQFVDRLWIRGLFAIGALYIIGVLIYGVAVGVRIYVRGSVEDQVAYLGPDYTNTIQLKQRYDILKQKEDLKFAGLNCWLLVAQLMPEGLSLDSLNFSEGKRLTLRGTAPPDQVSDINGFEQAMRKAEVKKGEKFFDPIAGEHFTTQPVPGGGVRWSFILELKRTEAL
ncbi:MAG: hypothetical protein C5B50_18540 [Verrucomicrobia bacterium]|nr:MAG: hypothetical protein C5B50_18540 [Verrucomicrobiota bacterium]